MSYQPLPVTDFQSLHLLANIAQAIDGDSDLTQWTQENYGRAINVFSGTDPENPPSEEEYPLVELVALDDHDSMTAECHERRIGVVLGICDQTKDAVLYSGLQMQNGILRLEELFEKVFAAISGADLAGGYIDSVSLRRDQESIFPHFMAGMEIQINKPRWPYQV